LKTRQSEREQLNRCTAEATATWDGEALAQALQARRVPAGVVANIQELVERDPQLAHRGHWIRLEHPVMGPSLYNAPPIRLSRTGFSMHSAAPLLGQHTEEICRDVLGMSDEDLSQSRQAGAFE